jgi:flagellar M-ring protein FliF
VVEVTLDTVTETETVRERRLDPESRVAISTDTEESSSNASDQGGGVTVASNLPEGDAGGGAPSTTRSDETRERVNFEVSSTEREILRTPGAIRRMSVAVLVNTLPETPEGTLATPSLLDRLAIDTMALIQGAVLALVALVLGLFVLRPVLMRPATAPAQLAPPPATNAQPALTGEIDDSRIDEAGLSVVSEVRPETGLLPDAARPQDPVARLRALIGERQEETVEILRTWLEGEEERV